MQLLMLCAYMDTDLSSTTPSKSQRQQLREPFPSVAEKRCACRTHATNARSVSTTDMFRFNTTCSLYKIDMPMP